MTTAPDIFLSYNREDQAHAKLFAEGFEAQGFKVWWDVGLRTGEAYDVVTETALRTAKAVVVLWSKKSVQSRWVRAEATLADRNKTLVPCMIEPCERPIMFELTQTAELGHWQGEAGDKAWLGFLADVQRFVAKSAPSVIAAPSAPLLSTPAPAPAPKRGGRPSLAILPFTNRSPDPADNIFAQGLVEDLIAALSLASGARVLSQSATAPYRKEALDLKRIGDELGVRYVLEGNVRRAGLALRVTCQLVQAATGAIVWTQMFARPLSELAELQDELVTELAGQLGAQVQRLEMDRALKKPGDWTAWEAVARSISYFSRFDDDSRRLGEEEARRAVALAPDYGLAQANLAHILSAAFTQNLDETTAAETRAAVERALALDPGNPTVLWKSARALGSIGLPAQALPLAERAIALMPFNAIAHGTLALCLMHLGRPRDALAAYDEEARLAPRAHGQFFILLMRSLAHLMLGEHDLALKAAEASLKEIGGYSHPAIVKATRLEALGRHAEAQEAVQACRKLAQDNVTPDGWAKAHRRIYAPEAVAMLAPAERLYRKAWDATPKDGR
ncbi:MAG: TIR domain-containing protein [Caulobacterales bacterium]